MPVATTGDSVNSGRKLTLIVCAFLCTSTLVNAQLPQTRLYAVSPPGGQIGQEFEVTVTSGADLDELSQLVFSNPKITARQKTIERSGEQVPVNNTFVVKIPADVHPSVVEIRCGGLFGFSNPRRFAIDHSKPASDPADNNSPEKAAPLQIGEVVNGRLESGNDIDWFRVSAQKGQRLIIDTWAERLDSRMNPVIAVYDSTGRRRLARSRNKIGNDPVLAFDVPQDGDYCIEIRDVTYRNGADYYYRLHAHTNPHIEFAWPPSGQAGSKSTFTLYGYNLPDSQKTDQSINSAQLEAINVEIDVPKASDVLDTETRVSPMAAAIDGFSYRYKDEETSSNPVFISITDEKVIVESEPNNDSKQAQTISVPALVGGQFGETNDNDTYRFQAKKGEVYFIDVDAERLGATADPYLIVNQITPKDDGTEQVKRLTAQDDVGTNLLVNVFDTMTDDPVFRLQVPADGLYEVVIRDRYWESRGSPLLRYALTIRQESPDFRVVAVPAAPTAGQAWPTGIRKGDQFPISVLAFRQDSFTGPIEIYAENLPDGVHCPPVSIGANETSSTLIISCDAKATAGIYEIKLLSRATIDPPKGTKTDANKQVIHPVRAGSVVWNSAANIPAISRVTSTISLTIHEEDAPFQVHTDSNHHTVNQSRQLLIPMTVLRRNGFGEKITLTTQGVPKKSNIDFPNSAIEKNETAKALRLFVKDTTPPGVYTIWMKTQGQVGYRRNPAKAERLKQEYDAAKAKADEAKKASEAATQAKTAAIAKVKASQEKLQASQAALKTAQAAATKAQLTVDSLKKELAAASTKLEAATLAMKKAATEDAAAKKNSDTKSAELMVVEKALATSQQVLVEAQKAVATNKEKIDGLTKQIAEQPDNAELKTQLDAANAEQSKLQATVQAATQKVNAETGNRDAIKKEVESLNALYAASQKKVQDLKKDFEIATKAVSEKEQQSKAATSELMKQQIAAKTSQSAMTTADNELKAATQAQTDAEAAEKSAQALAKSTEATRAAAEKTFQAADKAAKPKNINFTPPTSPIVVEVLPSPVKLASTVANGGKVKKGDPLEVTVKVTRQNNFKGPLTLTLATPSEIKGLSAEPVVIPADKAEGKITIKTSGDTPDGKIANVVVRSEMEFNGQAKVDSPIALELTK